MTSGIQKSIYIKNKLLKKNLNKKNPQINTALQEQYKTQRNLLFTLMKQSKQIHHKKYFENNWNNIKSTWELIKTKISVKNITTKMPHSIDFNKSIADLTATSNVLNKYFTSMAKKTNSNIKFSPKHYTYYYVNETQTSFS